MSELDYVLDCIELGDRAAFALAVRDRQFAARTWRLGFYHWPLFVAMAKARKEPT